jgi:hypothetical protein
MKRKGVLYDVGRVMGGNWRPDYSPAVVRRELEIIKTGLHCTAVKICARDTTLRHITRAAEAAEDLRARWPGQGTATSGRWSRCWPPASQWCHRVRVPDPDRRRPGRRRPGELPRPEHAAAHDARHARDRWSRTGQFI